MRAFQATALSAVAMFGAAGVWLGCGDDTTASSKDAGPGTDSSLVAETGSTAEAGAADSGTTPGDGGAPDGAVALTCPAYCAGIMATCTGPSAQYNPAVVEQCTNACTYLPLGDAGASAGDTVACRITHTGYAVTTPNPHCWHAGPYGFGACGDECEAFCFIATGYCSAAGGFDGGAPPYASNADCMTKCQAYARVNGGDAGFGVAGGYNAAGPTGGDTLDCREWHLGKALESAANQQVHCNHVGAVSPTCFAAAPVDAGDQ